MSRGRNGAAGGAKRARRATVAAPAAVLGGKGRWSARRKDDGGVGAAARGRTGELLLLAQGRAEQWGFPGILTDPGRLQVGPEPAVEVVADGDLPLLASLFPGT